MKRILLFGLVAVLGLSLLSCERKEMAVSDELTTEGDVFYAMIEQPQTPATKAYVDENYYVLWHADDRISVFNTNTFNRQYRYLGETGKNYGRFEMVPDNDFVAGNPLEHIYAVYPYKESNYIPVEGVMQVVLPMVQPYAEKSFAPGVNTMVSVTDSHDLIFKNACGYLGVKLYGENIGVASITLEGNDGELISGQAEIRMEVGGVPEITMVNEGMDRQKQVKVTGDPFVALGATEEEYTEFWFVLPPMTFEHGLTITVKGSEGDSFVKSTENAITIERSRIVHLEPVSAEELNQIKGAPITIDGDFSDWDALDPALVATASCDPDARRTALTLAKVFATSEYVYVYFEWNKDEIQHNNDEWVPLDCYINTDGDETTGGGVLFSDLCSDVLLEGYIYPGGVLGSYDAGAWIWNGEPNAEGWEWRDSQFADLDGGNNGITNGAGVEGKYELRIDRSKFEEIGYPIADTFSIGFNIYQSWDSAGLLPNAAVTDANPLGWAPTLQYPPVEQQPQTLGEITIDGQFDDWAALNPKLVSVAKSNPDSPWSAVKEIRCCMDATNVYYYILFDQDELSSLLENSAETLPIRLCINTDGEFTSGYPNYFLDSYDFIAEGYIVKNGAFTSFNGTFYQRIGSWVELGYGITSGDGAGCEYELTFPIESFNYYANSTSVPMPMGDEFQTGIRFYTSGSGGWNELSNVPNSSIDEVSNGRGHLMNVSVNGNGSGQTPDPEEELAPEIKNGALVCATNADVQQFLTDVSYPTHDYTYSSLLTWAEQNNVTVSPGDSDKPAEYTIRWKADASAGDVTVTLTEPTRVWTYTTTADKPYATITNLLPGTHYVYTAIAGSKTLTSGEFDTYGKLHQLSFRSRIRNCRDLGGWKTSDQKTVKYRKVYRGGRLEPSYLTSTGKRDLLTEGIKAQLDLRGQSDALTQSTLDGIVDDYAFCAPIIEQGYSQMLSGDKEKTRQCIQFIMDCVDSDKPVYFHCSLGRDRTGTVAMLVLGILGVPEGDISQEYELTQFAPHGYATAEGEKTKMTRIVDYRGAANYIWNNYVGSGETFRDGVEKYLLEIGIPQADIDKFRRNMLE